VHNNCPVPGRKKNAATYSQEEATGGNESVRTNQPAKANVQHREFREQLPDLNKTSKQNGIDYHHRESDSRDDG